MSMRNAKSLSDLLQGIVEVHGDLDREIQGVSLDSRHVVPGGLFIACAGISSHGLEYVEQAIRQGAVAVLWEPAGNVQRPSLPAEVAAIEVPRLAAVTGRIAAAFYGNPSQRMDVVGITGTNGKTSVSHLVAQAVAAYGRRCAIVGTLGYGFIDSLEPPTHTTPDAVKLQQLLAQLAGGGADSVAMEVSSHALEQHRVSGIGFRTAVFTNLGRDHLDYHVDLASYAAAKRRLFRMPELKSAVVNADDAVGRDIVAELPASVRAIVFATQPESHHGLSVADAILANRIEFDTQGLLIDVTYAGENYLLRAPLFGRFNALNLLAVFGVLLSFDINPADAARALSFVRPVRGRMERLGGGEQPLVIVDYAHTPDALAQILSAAREHCSGKLSCVFGCGGDRDRGKRPEMGRIAAALADAVTVTDDNPRTENADDIVKEILAGIADMNNVQVQRDRAIAIRESIAAASAGDVIVIAGKGHEDYQIVGTRREHFSDAEVARAALEGMS